MPSRLGLKIAATTFWEATNSKTLVDLDLDSLLLLGQQDATDSWEALPTNQTNPDWGYED